MATKNVSTTATEGKAPGLCEWQKQRLEMVKLVQEYNLTPLMDFAILIANDEEGILDLKEVSQILRLLITGMYVDLKMCCTTAGSGSYYDSRVLDRYLSEFPWEGGAS